MKVLFVCRQNIGRSQMAKAFYNKLTNTHDAEAAGTHVDQAGQTIEDRKRNSFSKNFFLLDVMDDIGIDLSKYIRTPLTENMMSDYDVIVSMAKKTDSPDWLLNSGKYVYWDVHDPRGQNYDVTAKIRDDIKHRVEELITKSSN